MFLFILGYEVTAFVRQKEKLGSTVPTRVIEGDVLDKGAVSQAVKDHDATIIALGTRNDLSIVLIFFSHYFLQCFFFFSYKYSFLSN